MTTKLADRMLAEMRAEFPTFEVRYKRGALLHKAIATALLIVTFGGQRSYMTRYHTVLFGKLWVPDAWDSMTDEDRYILLRHERVHLRQMRRLGFVKMTVFYMFVFFPLGLAYGRARIEWEAYVETLRATTELFGSDRARALKPWLVARFVGPDYGFMWPFPKVIDAWFEKAMGEIESERRLTRDTS